MKTVKMTWELNNYDVWGNVIDGYWVNQSYVFNREYPIRLKIEVNNPGKDCEFLSAYPSDYQIRKAFGVGCDLDLSGDDLSIYVNRESDGFPIGEMRCTSHSSLSPIRE